MSRVSTYLNFPRNTEEAFNFYKSVFGTQFSGQGIARFSDIPTQEGMPPLPEEDKKPYHAYRIANTWRAPVARYRCPGIDGI